MSTSVGSIAYDHRTQPAAPPAPSSAALLEAAHRLTRQLQIHLQVEALLTAFDAELQHLVPHEGLHYTNPEHDLLITPPSAGRHSCAYRLRVEDQPLGEIRFQRRHRFSAEDLANIEYLLSCLGYPLRNALLYRAATHAALMDLLSGAHNRTAFDHALPCEVARAARHALPLSLIVYDIDDFKGLNDRHGHQGGDHALRSVTRCVLEKIRTSDALYRYGGDEFVILLPSTPPEGAMALGERVRAAVAHSRWEWDGQPMPVTLSVGIASLGAGDDANSLFGAGDAALYAAKDAGRNCVRAAPARRAKL